MIEKVAVIFYILSKQNFIRNNFVLKVEFRNKWAHLTLT